MAVRELLFEDDAVMIEEALVGSNFLVPARRLRQESGYVDRHEFAAALKESWLIGHYDETGQFRVNRALMFQYHGVIPEIADALASDTHAPEYQKYKLAALQKGTMDVFFEWRLSSALRAQNLNLSAARLLRDRTGLPTLLVDMGGPTYEVVAPDTVDAFINSFEVDRQDYHANAVG